MTERPAGFQHLEGYLAVWTAYQLRVETDQVPGFAVIRPRDGVLRRMTSSVRYISGLHPTEFDPEPHPYVPDGWDEYSKWVLGDLDWRRDPDVKEARRVFKAFRYLCEASGWISKREERIREVKEILAGTERGRTADEGSPPVRVG